mgnify:CR=1 FL=1
MNNRIKELRKQKKITQDELAKAVEVTRQTIISLENGKYNASLHQGISEPILKMYLFLRRNSDEI